MNRFKDFIIGEVLDTISCMQLNGTEFPEMSSDRIEAIANSIVFEWNEIGDPDANLEELIKWTIEQNLSHA